MMMMMAMIDLITCCFSCACHREMELEDIKILRTENI